MKASLLGLSLFVFSFSAIAQTELPPGYYVVVAAYGKKSESLAVRFSDQLKAKGHTSKHGFDSGKNLFFVYLTSFTDLGQSLKEMKRTRRNEIFSDAWVRVVNGNPDSEQSDSLVSTENNPSTQLSPVTSASSIEPKPKEEPVDKASIIKVDSSKSISDVVEEEEKIIQYNPMTLGNTEVFLSLFHGAKDQVINGEVQVIDTERSKLITKVKGNNYLLLPDPKSKTGMLTLTCDAFGYRKVQHELHYPLPLSDTVKEHIDLMGTTIVVLFDLVRYRRGDIQTLYNVYFFNDAALMLPESKYELSSLLTMMQENPSYKIKLHGHTNGHYHGKIISLGPDKNFFSLTGSRQTIGSAKDLAGQRAGIIKEYLVSNGISASRIEVKAWGGKKPLYDKHGANAKKNVRVEVEILED